MEDAGGSVKNKFFTHQVCATGSINIGTLAARSMSTNMILQSKIKWLF